MYPKIMAAYDERLLIEDEVLNRHSNRMASFVTVENANCATEEELKAVALSNPRVQDRIAGKAVRKVIVVPKKLVNVVVNLMR